MSARITAVLSLAKMGNPALPLKVSSYNDYANISDIAKKYICNIPSYKVKTVKSVDHLCCIIEKCCAPRP